jgi:hypothetical protein
MRARRGRFLVALALGTVDEAMTGAGGAHTIRDVWCDLSIIEEPFKRSASNLFRP